jgi:hypothetical protein
MNKHILRQRLYENVVAKINQYSKCYIVLSVRYYKSTKFLAKIIQKAAFLKGNEKIAHTAAIYKFGHDPRLFEAITSGVNHASLYDSYFNGSFKGRVEAHVLPAKQTSNKRLELSNYIEHELLGREYDILKAIKAYIDFFSEPQEDNLDSTFCTDIVMDVYERITNKSCHFVENNAEITPAQLHRIIRERELERFLVIDTEEL